MQVKRFEDLQVWQKARILVNEVYQLSDILKNQKDFGLADQMRRAAISVLSNIAEGFERNGNKEFQQFLSIAKGSAGELRAQLYIALDQKIIMQENFDKLKNSAEEISRMLSGLITSLRESQYKGSKTVKSSK